MKRQDGVAMVEFVFLIVLLFMMVLISYTVFRGDLLSPSFLCAAMYLFSCFVMLIYYNEWNTDFSFITGLVIAFSVFCVFLGDFTATVIQRKRISQNDSAVEEDGPIIIGKVSSVFCFLFSIVTAVLYFQEIRKIAAHSAYAQSIYGQAYSFLMQVRWAKMLEGANVAYYVQQMFTCLHAMALVFLFIIIRNRIYYGKQKRMVLPLLTVVIYIVTSFMTTGRASMLNFFIYAIVIGIILDYKKREWHHRNNIRVIMKAVGLVGVALLLFYIAGLLTEKSLHYDNFFDNFANYFSSSIYCLNKYIENPTRFSADTNFFGIHTFSGIYSFLRKLGLKIPDSIVALEFIRCGKYNTNIYTPLRRYLQDFTILGSSLIMFLIGFAYKRALMSLKRAKNFDLSCIVVGMFFYPLFFISIEERVFMDVIMMRSLYEIIYVVLIYQWIVKGKIFKYKVRGRRT